MAKSTYFNTRLSTAGIGKATAVIREYAASMEEVRAMEYVVEFMYTEKLSLDCVAGTVADSRDRTSGEVSVMRRLLAILAVSCEVICFGLIFLDASLRAAAVIACKVNTCFQPVREIRLLHHER